MSQRPRDLAGLLRDAMEARLSDLHVSLPAEVKAYDNDAQTVDVQPLVKRVTTDPDTGADLAESFPQINAVPVAFPRSGDAFMSFPIQPGDTVLLIFCERSIDQWQAKGGEQDPGFKALHHISFAVAIPGVYATPNKLVDTSPDHIVMGWDGGKKVVVRTAGVDIGSESGPEKQCLATTLQTWVNQMAAFGTMIDSVVSGWTPVPTDGGLALKTAYIAARGAALPPAAATIESTKHTIDE